MFSGFKARCKFHESLECMSLALKEQRMLSEKRDDYLLYIIVLSYLIFKTIRECWPFINSSMQRSAIKELLELVQDFTIILLKLHTKHKSHPQRFVFGVKLKRSEE